MSKRCLWEAPGLLLLHGQQYLHQLWHLLLQLRPCSPSSSSKWFIHNTNNLLGQMPERYDVYWACVVLLLFVSVVTYAWVDERTMAVITCGHMFYLQISNLKPELSIMFVSEAIIHLSSKSNCNSSAVVFFRCIYYLCLPFSHHNNMYLLFPSWCLYHICIFLYLQSMICECSRYLCA